MPDLDKQFTLSRLLMFSSKVEQNVREFIPANLGFSPLRPYKDRACTCRWCSDLLSLVPVLSTSAVFLLIR